jgi:DNA repair ATPase RecN
MLFKRIVGLIALLFGFLGVVGCVAGASMVLSLASRLERTNDKVFALVDQGLASGQDRVRGVQKRLEESKITTTEIGQSLRDWGKRKTRESLVSELEIEVRAEKLSGHLQTADSWLETSAESVRSVQQLLELGNSLGASLDPTALEGVLEKLAALQSRLQETERRVDGIREFAAAREADPEQNRLSRVTRLVGRVLVTIGEINPRLEDVVMRLSELQTDAHRLNTRISTYIWLGATACWLLLAWLAAGQTALCAWGWRKCRSR